jgi:hypothetical protein
MSATRWAHLVPWRGHHWAVLGETGLGRDPRPLPASHVGLSGFAVVGDAVVAALRPHAASRAALVCVGPEGTRWTREGAWLSAPWACGGAVDVLEAVPGDPSAVRALRVAAGDGVVTERARWAFPGATHVEVRDLPESRLLVPWTPSGMNADGAVRDDGGSAAPATAGWASGSWNNTVYVGEVVTRIEAPAVAQWLPDHGPLAVVDDHLVVALGSVHVATGARDVDGLWVWDGEAARLVPARDLPWRSPSGAMVTAP